MYTYANSDKCSSVISGRCTVMFIRATLIRYGNGLTDKHQII